MNEAETRAEHIDPALRAAGWGGVDKQARLARARSYIPDDSTVHTVPADPLTIYQTPEKTHSGCTEPSFLPVQLSSLAPQSVTGFWRNHLSLGQASLAGWSRWTVPLRFLL